MEGIGVGVGPHGGHAMKNVYKSKDRNEAHGNNNDNGVQSTKSNPKKNLELRFLFNRTKQG